MLALFAAMHSYVIQAGDQDVIKELVTVYEASVWEKNRDGMDAWDVSRVTSMNVMLYYATAFKQALNAWDVSSVTSMR